ncbi:hypothetical protein D3C73_954810 [compost metagenome]
MARIKCGRSSMVNHSGNSFCPSVPSRKDDLRYRLPPEIADRKLPNRPPANSAENSTGTSQVGTGRAPRRLAARCAARWPMLTGSASKLP